MLVQYFLWTLNEPDIDSEWTENKIGMIPKCTRDGMNPNWTRNKPEMNPKCRNGAGEVFKAERALLQSTPEWVRNEHGMNPK